MWYAPETLNTIAKKIRNNQVGLFPFDTVWGLTARHDPSCFAKLTTIKQRPENQAILTVIGAMKWLDKLTANIPTPIQKWIPTIWPGPITLLLPKHPDLPDYITAGKPNIAVRFPDFFLIDQLLDIVDEPLFSTSANFHQTPPPKTRNEIPSELTDQLDFVFDSIPPLDVQASTIIDCSTVPPQIIRKGQIVPKIYPK